MAAPKIRSDFHVLVVGAGSVGLLIAQRLKHLGIKCTVFEREKYLNERSRDWSFGIYCTYISELILLSKAMLTPNSVQGPRIGSRSAFRIRSTAN